MKIVQLNKFAELLDRIDKEDRSFAFLAGGTDIMPAVNFNYFDKEVVFDLSLFRNELHFIKENEKSIEIGALISLAEIANNKIIVEKVPQLADSINSIGSKQIRNMGTLAGNIANASPIADSSPVLLTLNVFINAISSMGERAIPIDDFFIDYKKTSLRKNEIIKSISIPFNNLDGKYGFRKVSARPEIAIAKINLAYAIQPNNVRFASGGAAKMPVRLKNVENNWGKDLSVKEWISVLNEDISPISDIRSTAEYRTHILANIIEELSQSSPE